MSWADRSTARERLRPPEFGSASSPPIEEIEGGFDEQTQDQRVWVAKWMRAARPIALGNSPRRGNGKCGVFLGRSFMREPSSGGIGRLRRQRLRRAGDDLQLSQRLWIALPSKL
jgi:hypothetical protein